MGLGLCAIIDMDQARRGECALHILGHNTLRKGREKNMEVANDKIAKIQTEQQKDVEK